LNGTPLNLRAELVMATRKVLSVVGKAVVLATSLVNVTAREPEGDDAVTSLTVFWVVFPPTLPHALRSDNANKSQIFFIRDTSCFFIFEPVK
jgi:hypothetical protein